MCNKTILLTAVAFQFLLNLQVQVLVHATTDVTTTTTTTSFLDDIASLHGYYDRYDFYPPYCSTPEFMDEQRNIPPLTSDSKLGKSRLLHVTAIARHGARTPWKGGLQCWDGYNHNPETAVWNCTINTISAAPPPLSSQQQDDNTHNEPFFLFAKHYDALVHPHTNNNNNNNNNNNIISNELNGTCQKGQLIQHGYRQEVFNGQQLRKAYVYSSSSHNHHKDTHDPRMRLLDTAVTSTNVWDHIYFRADDDQRTVMSGQLILRGMLGPEVAAAASSSSAYPILPLHIADRSRDILDPNEQLCPRLAEIRERYTASLDYRIFNESIEVQTLRNFQRQQLGVNYSTTGDMDAGIDCLMTTICTDRPLPQPINDYTGGDEDTEQQFDPPANTTDYGTDLFLRLYNYFVRKSILPMMANQAEYSKLAMGPLWAEIWDNINATIHRKDDIDCCPYRPMVPKLALFAGHDTTLIPLLASIGAYDEKWPSYASMMLIEIHELNLDGQGNKEYYPLEFGFRLIYNGNVITHKILGCPLDAQICSIDRLSRLVESMATRQPLCARQHPIPVEHTDTISQATELLSTTSGLGSFILLVIGSMAFGAVGTYLAMSSSSSSNPNYVRKRRNYRAAPVMNTDDDGIGMIDLNHLPHHGDDDDDTRRRVGSRQQPYSDNIADNNIVDHDLALT